jgi:hypothetical protein
MTIAADITTADLRALYWRVMYPEKMRLGLALSLAGVLMLLCLAGVDGPEFLVFLRYIGRLCLWLFVGLLVILLWTHFASHKEWASWMRATGEYTYELEDRRLVVTDAAGRREFSTKAIQAQEETPQHICIIMRKGPHYIIPKRDLTGEEKEAVMSFREAVAFASLHVDMLGRT